ncbi:MAG: AraC family transcriptional regulator, partial [Lacrimispora sp.]
ELLCSKIITYNEFGMIQKAYEASLENLFSLDMPSSAQHLYRTIGNDTVLKAAVEDRDQQIVLWSLKNWMLKIDKTEAECRLRLMKRLVYSLGIYFLHHGIAPRTVASLYEPLKAGDYQGGKESVISFVKSEFWQESKGGGKNANLCKEVSKYISENYTDDITLNELADKFYISPNYLGTLFKKNLGIGIREYQTTIRLEQADTLIASGKFKLYQVAQMVGYSNYEYFRKIYCKYKGKNPSE